MRIYKIKDLVAENLIPLNIPKPGSFKAFREGCTCSPSENKGGLSYSCF